MSDLADRTLTIERRIAAPVARVWAAWTDPARLPEWWGPDGFSCRTKRIALGAGGEWVFDMIGPDGAVYPNHHLYHSMQVERQISYTLLMGENGPRHADCTADFIDLGQGQTLVCLTMVMGTVEEARMVRGFGAEALGLQTLGKLARAAGEKAA